MKLVHSAASLSFTLILKSSNGFGVDFTSFIFLLYRMVTEGFVNLRNTLWRWNRDSNPGRVSPHTLSKRADSAALAFHPIYFGGLAEPDPPSLATAVARSIYFEGLAEPDPPSLAPWIKQHNLLGPFILKSCITCAHLYVRAGPMVLQ